MQPTQENPNSFPPHCFDPFPEPQTIPSGWDMSELLPSSGSVCAAEREDSTEE
jgi:hypothetical protein